MRKERDKLGFYYPSLCFQTFAPKYVAIGRKEWGRQWRRWRRFRQTFMLLLILFPSSSSCSPSQTAEKNQVNDFL